MKKIFVFGNPLVEEDAVQLKVVGELRKEMPEIEFVELDSYDDLEQMGRQPVIIDAVEGINKVELITDLERIASPKVVSMHDFDLGFNLKLMKKLGKIESVKIIALPVGMEREKALKEVKKIISKRT